MNLLRFIIILLILLFVPTSCNVFKNGQTTTLLPIPPLLEDLNPDPQLAEFNLIAQKGLSTILPGKLTATLGYNGALLGPTIYTQQNETVLLHVKNELDEPTTVHWHGLEIPGDMDGGPDQSITPFDVWNPSFTLHQPAFTGWYHPHQMGLTASQVYRGLAGFWFHSDSSESSRSLPHQYGVNDIPVVVQDRAFNNDGSLNYSLSMMHELNTDTLLLNGVTNPFFNITTKYLRLRLLNGSNGFPFYFSFSDPIEVQQIATDGGYLNQPVLIHNLTLAPGERAELILDFSTFRSGQNGYMLINNQRELEFRNGEVNTNEINLPNQLNTIQPYELTEDLTHRSFVLSGSGAMVTINQQPFSMNRIDFTTISHQLEIWTISNQITSGGMMNGMAMGHPFHVHGVQFQIISRNHKKPPLNEQGWKDTVYLLPDEIVEIAIQFQHEGHYYYHCHILEHEEAGMMGQFIVASSLLG